MARPPMVTRTVTITRAKVLCINLESESPFTQEVTLPRTYKDERSMLKRIKPMLETGSVKVVHVQNFEIEEDLYGMTEQQFVESATKLPKRNTTK